MRIRLAAGALVTVALVTAAWFALGVRQARDTQAASTIVADGSAISASQARHAAQLLRAAELLNPNTNVDVLRAELDLYRGKRLAARSILERVVADEPDNAVAWEWLARASVGDLHEFFLAAFRLRQLVPPVRPAP
jgi:predicted Zn-dependent protease